MPPDHVCQNEEEGRPVCSREMKGTEGEWEKIARQKGEAAWISPSCFLLSLTLLGFTGFTAALTLTKLWFETHSSRRTHSLSVKFGKANLISFFGGKKKSCSVINTAKGLLVCAGWAEPANAWLSYPLSSPRRSATSGQSSTGCPVISSKQHTNELPASAQTALHDGSTVAAAFAKEKKEAWKQGLSFPSGTVSKPIAQPQIPFHLHLISWAKLTISSEPRPHGRPTMAGAGIEAEMSPVEIDFSRTVYKVHVHISKATLLFPHMVHEQRF